MTRHGLLVSAIVIAVVSLVAGAFITHRDDVNFYIDWQTATTGWRPWNAYAVPLNNYPPVVLYVLTALEAVRDLSNIAPRSRANDLLIKLPNLLAQLVGGWVLFRAMAPRLGEGRAVALAFAWVASFSFFANVIWGQWDAFVSLLLLLAMLAAARDALGWFGFWLGIALATKFQIVFAMPVAAVYLIARTGWRGTLVATLGGVTALALAFAPMALGGRLNEATAVYFGSVDTFPRRSLFAWNIWEIANGVEVKIFRQPLAPTLLDNRPLIPALGERFTHRSLGLLLFVTYLIALLVLVARRPTLRTLLLCVPLAGVAMFMLATQMHDRYIVPPAALMVFWLLLERPYRVQFFYWMIAAGINQLMSLFKHQLGGFGMNAYVLSAAVVAPINVLMFAWLTWLIFRDRGEGVAGLTRDADAEPATSSQPSDAVAAGRS